MPILIRELVIKARVEPNAAERSASQSDDGGKCDCDPAVDTDKLSRILADQKER